MRSVNRAAFARLLLAATFVAGVSTAHAQAAAPWRAVGDSVARDSSRAAAVGDSSRAPAVSDSSRGPAARDSSSAPAVSGAIPAPAARDSSRAPADSSFDSYMRGLSDSTDTWFGAMATPVDTAGLDSALAAGLALPPGKQQRRADQRRVRLDFTPAPGYNRADGAQLGVGASLTRPLPGRLSGRAMYTTGTKDVIGDGGWDGSFRLGQSRSRLALRAQAGRWTDVADRDSYDPVVTTMAAIVFGGDLHQYLRRDGWRASARWERDRVWASVAWRDQLESALPFTTEWALFGSQELDTNFTAAYGRVHELGITGEVPVPGTRFRVQAGHWTSAPAWGSAFDYNRTLVAVGGDISFGRHFAFVPQASYGRLHGEVLPQNPFFFGGAPNVRQLDRNEWSGSGRAFGRADLMLVDDLHELLRLPLPAWMPLHLSGFLASGAVWGRDPVTNQALPTRRDWPSSSEWLSETGLTLAWRIGIPEPTSSMRFEYTEPLGATGRTARYTVVYQQPLHLLRMR